MPFSLRDIENCIASDSDRKKLLQFLRRRLAMLYSTQETAIDDEAIENGLCESHWLISFRNYPRHSLDIAKTSRSDLTWPKQTSAGQKR